MIKRLELVQTAKVGLSEIKNRAAQFGYSVSYCIFDKRPIAILHSGSMNEGGKYGVKQNLKRVNGELELCMENGDAVQWSQFIYRGINKNRFNEYNLYIIR